MTTIDPAEFVAARERGKGVVLHTPVVPSVYLSEMFSTQVVLKAENLQRTGAFKIRGGMNKLATLGKKAKNGVVAGSAGNHAQGLALAASTYGVRCEIFVPRGASLTKIAACRHYGATVIEGGDNVEVAVQSAIARAEESGMAFCHPYDDPDVVAGQGTLGLELLEDIRDLDTVIIPLGGGGLLSGTAIAIKQQRPGVRVIGVQVQGCDPYVTGQVPRETIMTLADGIAVKNPGKVTKPLIDKWVDDIVAVEEDHVADAMVMLMERSKLLVEGGGAVGLSALLAHRVTPSRTGVTCLVLSGGNVDVGNIPNLVRRHETTQGRRLTVFVRLPDRPGSLASFLDVLAKNDANIVEVQHVREGVALHSRETGVQVVLEIKNPEHGNLVVNAAQTAGFSIGEIVFPK